MVVNISHVIPYVIHVHGCWWVGFQLVVGKVGGPTLLVSGFHSGGLPEWGHLVNLGLGWGCSGPFGSLVGFVRRWFPGSTIVLEGIV